MPRLVVVKGPDEGRVFDVGDVAGAVGRDASNRVRLQDTEVSRKHFEFRRCERGFELHDLGSANGTYVNERKVQACILRSGDRVALGQTVLLYTDDARETPTADRELARKINLIVRGDDVEIGSALVKAVPEGEGSRILSDPDRTSPWVQSRLANLTILYEASQAVSHILDVPELLVRLLELIFRSVPADRGCALLADEEGELTPRAVHWARKDHPDEIDLSRTIVDHVLGKRQGVLLSDAGRDDRFAQGKSIARYGIREVICVPMKGRHETIGVLYLDTQLSARDLAAQPTVVGRFNEDHLSLAIAVAHQAALAVEETRYHQALLQAERLAAIGQTIASLSHHVKNILQGLRSGNEILKMGIEQKNDRLLLQGWRVAERNQAKVYDLVMDMLSYSKERTPAIEPTDVNELVADLLDLLGPRAQEHGVTLERRLKPDLGCVPLDPDGMQRAVLNLVGNAIDAVEGREGPKVLVATDVDDGWLTIAIEDNGVGIPEAKRREIFRPFVSSKGAKGTGLGLPVSEKIVREHGGEIVVTSVENVGSRFLVRLPLKSPVDALGMTSLDLTAPPEAN